jgi:hypothetical protein
MLEQIEKEIEFWEGEVLSNTRTKARRAVVIARIDFLKQLRTEYADLGHQVELAKRAAYSYQSEVDKWMQACFGKEISDNQLERGHRFIEEAIELVQSINVPKDDVLMLVDYVYNRPVGDPPQEVGGVMVTLSALCSARKINLMEAARVELKRVWEKIAQVRNKQATKPRNSPLPMHVDEVES